MAPLEKVPTFTAVSWLCFGNLFGEPNQIVSNDSKLKSPSFSQMAISIPGSPFIDDLNTYANKRQAKKGNKPELAVRYTDSSGRARVHGGKDLKASQAYPRRPWLGWQKQFE